MLLSRPNLGAVDGCIFPTGSLFANWFCGAPAAAYESAQYGTIPKVVAAQPAGVPSSYDYETGTLTSSDVAAIQADLAQQSLNKTAEANAAAYDAAVASGSYVPEGKLPISATELESLTQKYGKWILFGLLGIGAWAVLKR